MFLLALDVDCPNCGRTDGEPCVDDRRPPHFVHGGESHLERKEYAYECMFGFVGLRREVNENFCEAEQMDFPDSRILNPDN